MQLYWVWLIWTFAVGAAVGSLLNVCITRIPLEKSIFWPNSRCLACLQPIRWYHNIPVLSYWLLRGRCHDCQAPFSIRHFWIELFTGLAFSGVFYLEVVQNIHGLQAFGGVNNQMIRMGVVPWTAWVFFIPRALLLSFLIVVSMTDIDSLEIPLSITVTGMVTGLVCSALLPWPWPDVPGREAWAPFPAAIAWMNAPQGLPRTALVPWPLWDPMPAWLPAGSWQSGLVGGLAGLLAGLLPRAVGFLYFAGRGQQGMGLGDADLMMMVGCYLGWQVVIVAFLVAVVPGLFIGIVQLFVHGDQPFPFGPSLALGTVITWLAWDRIGPHVAFYFFNGWLLVGFGLAGAVFLYLASLLLGVVRGPPEPLEQETTTPPSP